MKGDTALDYAEFQLTPKRTRCELFISADGLMEKLASGFVKPFITHLHAAELQVVEGSHVIRLETKSEWGKNPLHHQGKDTWFSKGTIERFVRFVSTPEIIERVKTIEDELTQLEQVRIALVNTFAQTSDKFLFGDALTGQQQTRDGIDTLMSKRLSTDKDNEPDASKKELLRAMEARLNALHQEQDIAFFRANAAGFDNRNIADLMTFAQQFSADRLHDACAHFVALLSKKTVPEGGAIFPAFETPSDVSGATLALVHGSMPVSKEEVLLHSTKRRLDFGSNRPQAAKFGGNETSQKESDMPKRELGQKGNITKSNSEQISDSKNDGMLHAQLQQKAQEIDASLKEDSGWLIDDDKEHTFRGSEREADSSSKNRLSNSCLTGENSFLPASRVCPEGSPKQHPSPSKMGTSRDEDELRKQKDTAKIPEEVSNPEPDKSNGTQLDAPARRLSVQAAISLFESKKKDPNEHPFRKLTKQESRKTFGEGVSPLSEKSVLKRWTVQSPCHLESNAAQEAQMLDNKVREDKQDSGEVKIESGANHAYAASKDVVNSPQARPNEQVRENFKKSLSSLLQHDSVRRHHEQANKSESMDESAPYAKSYTCPIQEPSNTTGGSNIRSDSKSLPSSGRSTSTAKLGSEKAELEAATTCTMAKTVLVKQLPTDIRSKSEVENSDELLPSSKSIDSKRGAEQEEDKEMVKSHRAKETSLPKPSQIIPPRSQYSSQVSADAAFEPEKIGAPEVAILQLEQVLEKKIEKVGPKEPSVTNDRQSGRNTSSGKASVQKKMSPVKELTTNFLAPSADLPMQALVQIVEHQYTNSSFHAIDSTNEQRGEQRGRYYNEYAKLRDAKLRGEHPAKKAEREAKLKSMQETLERRRAEMQSRAKRVSKKNIQDAQTGNLGGERTHRDLEISAAMVEQKDLRVEDDDMDQEEYGVKAEDQVPEYSNPASPATTPRSWKGQGRSLSLKLQATVRTVPALSKSVSNNRNMVHGGGSSPKPSSKNPGGALSQGKQSSLNTSITDTVAVKSVLNGRDVAKTSVIRPGGSARVHPRLSVVASEATNPMDEPTNLFLPGNAERHESKNQPTSTRKNSTMSRSLNMDAGTPVAYLKDQQEGASNAVDSTPQKTGSTQEARPFLRKGHGIGPGAGMGIAKEKASRQSSKSPDGEKSTQSKQDDVHGESKNIEIAPENSLECFAANDEMQIQDQDSSSSGFETMPILIDESGSYCSRPSTGTKESVEVEATDETPERTSDNKKLGPNTIITNESLEETGPGIAEEAAPPGFFLQLTDQKQNEAASMLSDYFPEKNTDTIAKNASHFPSSVSFREALLLTHGQIQSPFPVSVSHPYSSMLQRGAVSSRFSPPREDLPSSSPALWNVSQSSKLGQDGELSHSARRLTGNQKQPSMLPLPPKEPSKGFKRLLHFGRKSRTSENTTDCISVSTTSEGDDDADEARESGSQLSEELLQKLRMQKRGFEYGNMGDQVSYADQDASHFFATAIPPPPANFKLRDELLSGGNLIKAPRSFFSLSSFRSSKGGEGKSR